MAAGSDGFNNHLEFNYENKILVSGDHEDTEAIVLRVFENKLAGRIGDIIHQQTSRALDQLTATRTFAGSTSREVTDESLLHVLEGERSASGGSTVARRTGNGGELRMGSDQGSHTQGSDMVEPFDPEDKFVDLDRWLSVIDRLGEIHGWSEYEKLHFMQIKLRGSARDWFSRLDDFSCSWNEWKAKLRQAFPPQIDYAESLEKLVARHKLPSETMTKYFHAKLALCLQCGIMDEKAVSCIIRGLPEALRANAYALAERQTAPQRRDAARCYNCQKLGHFSSECKKPRAERCRVCHQTGHMQADCTKRRRTDSGGGSRERRRRLATYPDEKGVNQKIYNKYDEPYRIANVLPNDRYEINCLQGAKGYKRFKASALRRYQSGACVGGVTSSDESSDDNVAVWASGYDGST
ncbi:hypothetical protein NQ317_015044 [Molorchus minor]|uniref:CCHC-type domain-containing protein n=1 Tax=Molorchus minor TaxID=1323400 RepID=A0ABQ9K669_9CUCU|nr:hypothetical protein NQ317_015044 [Molorchus minor]